MIGKTLAGHYRLLRPLGKGGFGQTYLAENILLPNKQQCAIKHFQPPDNIPHAALEQAERSFEREAKVLHELGRAHPQIPRLLAYFEEKNQFFLVQEFIEGENLEREIKPGNKLSEADVIDLLEKILEILTFVHQKGVIHRDIKPSNIMRRSKDGMLFLIDFGSVKQEISTQIGVGSKTKSQFAFRSPGYTPYEQEKLNPQRASDVYALGMTAIFALTGIYPYEFAENESTREICWRDRANINSKFADFLDRMVRHDYRQRYPSAVEALEALQQLKSSQKHISSTPAPKLSELKKIAATTALLLALSGGGYYIWQQNISLSTYKSSQHGLTMAYPSNWEFKQVDDYVTIAEFYPPNQNNNSIKVTVETEDIDLNTTLDRYVTLAIASIVKYLPEARIIDSEPIELNHQSAHKIVYSGKNSGLTNKYMQVLLLEKNQAYVVTYVSPEARYQEFITTVEETIIPSLAVESSK